MNKSMISLQHWLELGCVSIYSYTMYVRWIVVSLPFYRHMKTLLYKDFKCGYQIVTKLSFFDKWINNWMNQFYTVFQIRVSGTPFFVLAKGKPCMIYIFTVIVNDEIHYVAIHQ